MAITPEALRLHRELRAQLDRILDEELRDLTKAWVRAWDEVSVDLRDVLVDLLSADTEITRTKLLRAERLKRALAVIAKQLEDLAGEAQLRILSDLTGVIDTAGAAQAAVIASQLPSDSKLVDRNAWARVDQRQIEAIVRRTTERITSRLQPLSAEATDVVRRELIRGVAAGSNPKVVARAMVRRAEHGFNGGLTRALAISRTEMIDAHRAAAAKSQAQHSDVLTGWMWLAHLTPRTCRSCIGMHGRIFDIEEPGPEDHPQGRCTRMPTTKPWSELGFDVDEPPSVVPDADEFFGSLTPDEQRSLLGRRGHEAWLAGHFPRDAWAEKQHNDGWRDAYIPAKPPLAGAAGGSGSDGLGPPAPPGGVHPTGSAGSDEPLPPMGRLLGTPEQQVYVKDGAPYVPSTGPHGIILPPWRINDANAWHTYVPDDEDRTTALIQYLKSGEVLVKKIAKDKAQRRARTHATEKLIDEFLRNLQAADVSGVAGSDYDRTDLVADLEGAAARLLRRPVEDLGVVYRGIRLDGFDPRFDNLADLPGLLQLGDWWLTSASPAYETAKGYTGWPYATTSIVLIITDARGVPLESMGRMSDSPEVLLSGGIELTSAPRLVNGMVLIRARWKP